MADKEVRAPLLQRTRLRYVQGQDRILLDGATRKDASGKDKELALWMTRSVALELFKQLRSSLEKGSATAGKIAPGWRQEALAIEHAAILKTNAGKGPGAPWRGEGQPQLITRAAARAVNDKVQLVFWTGKTAAGGMV